jgi:DNA invertase Pin-like site-specific DNA recombinase
MFGYCRVSTTDQNLDRQLDAVRGVGVPEENIHTEKLSGSILSADRPQLAALLQRLRSGDTLWLDELSRLGRTMSDVVVLVHTLVGRGVRVRCVAQQLDTGDEVFGPLIVSLLAWLAQMERTQLLARQESAKAARIARGQPFGRPHAIRDATVRSSIVSAWRAGTSTRELARAYGVGKSTVARYIREDGGA